MPDQATALRRLAQSSATLREIPVSESVFDSPVVRELSPLRGGGSNLTPLPAASRSSAARSTRAPQGSRASVIAVTSGKGGVGKSNIAVNLAVRFSAAGKRVLLLDADLGLANADVLCNVEVPFNLSHVVSRRKTLREVVVRVPLGSSAGAGGERGASVGGRGGFDLIGGASGLTRLADLDESGRRILLEGLSDLERGVDVVLIDTGAGISSNVLSFCRNADNVLVVTTPEPTAITDAYAMVKSVAGGTSAGSAGGVASERKVSLLVNWARSPEEARGVYERVSRVARQFLGVNVLDAGYVLADEEVGAAVRRRMPVVLHSPSSPASECLRQLAMRLEPGVLSEQSGGFFSRLMRRVKGRA